MPPDPSPAERRLKAQIAANLGWANTPDRSARTEPARRGLQESWERKADPDRVLTPQERAKRVENLKRAHFQRMALASAESRRRRSAELKKATEPDAAAVKIGALIAKVLAGGIPLSDEEVLAVASLLPKGGSD